VHETLGIVIVGAALVAFIVWKSPALKHVKITAGLLKLITRVIRVR
jgi:hypothetical protein